MGKKKNFKKRPDKELSDESENEEENVAVVRRKPLRPKSSVSSKSVNDGGNDDYDADSEPDLKLEDIITAVSPNLVKSFTKCKAKLVDTNRDTVTILKDFSVNLSDCMQKKSLSNKLALTDKKKRCCLVGITESSYVECMCDECILKDQENVTPPGCHSMPAILKTAKSLDNLDDSLFGFNSVEQKLDYSMESTTDVSVKDISKSSNKSITTTYSRSSISKRKHDLSFDDVVSSVTGAPKRQHKRKKNEKENAVNKEKEKEALESLLQQFQEVEMHELVVE